MARGLCLHLNQLGFEALGCDLHLAPSTLVFVPCSAASCSNISVRSAATGSNHGCLRVFELPHHPCKTCKTRCRWCRYPFAVAGIQWACHSQVGDLHQEGGGTRGARGRCSACSTGLSTATLPSSRSTRSESRVPWRFRNPGKMPASSTSCQRQEPRLRRGSVPVRIKDYIAASKSLQTWIRAALKAVPGASNRAGLYMYIYLSLSLALPPSPSQTHVSCSVSLCPAYAASAPALDSCHSSLA